MTTEPHVLAADRVDVSVQSELEAERRVLARIARVRAAQIATVAERAERLATEAAELTEDGLRDIYDEDDDPDAAVQASFVRERAVHAMAAARRFQDVEGVGSAPAFGRTSTADDERLYIGRCSVIDGDEALLVDWRARAAIPFYRATPLEPLGLDHRRHLHYEGPDDARELTSYSDEVFSATALDRIDGLQGEAALLAALDRETTGNMASVVATIQAEQDSIIRAPAGVPLLVQGGPGTGKTVVALHRAAYLLYDQRHALAENGVLILGPTSHFLAYISEVLPSLGETGVVSAVPAQLYPGVRRGRVEPAEVAAIKGRLEMAQLLRQAIGDRQRRPSEPLVAWYGSGRVTLGVEEACECFAQARRSTTHNEGAERFRVTVIEALASKVYERAFDNYADAYKSFARSRAVRVFLLRHWPTLTPEQALNDLLGSSNLLRLAARGTGLRSSQVAAMARPRVPEAELANARWSDADIPLLDELWSAVGGLPGTLTDEEIQAVRDARDEFEIAAAQDILQRAASSRGSSSAGSEDGGSGDGDGAEAVGLLSDLPEPPVRAYRV